MFCLRVGSSWTTSGRTGGLRRWAGSDPPADPRPQVAHHVRLARPTAELVERGRGQAHGRRLCVTAPSAAELVKASFDRLAYLTAAGFHLGLAPARSGVQVKVPHSMPEFIYSMHNVRKKLGDKVVLDNVTLSFYPSAKIGVVGPNGTGKSTLLKLMAGIEKPNNGDATLAKDATVGILLQEPPLTEGKTVLENVEEGVADIKALQARMDELGVAMGEPDADFDALMAEMGEVQTELDAGTPGTSTLSSSRRWTRCAARRRTRWSTSSPAESAVASRSASCCCSSRTCCCSTSRRTIWMPSRCSGWKPT